MPFRWPRAFAAALLSVVCSSSVVARSDDSDLCGRIRAGEYAAAAKSLEDASFAEKLRSDSARLRSTAEATADRAGLAGQRGDLLTVVDFVLKAGEAAVAANANDADAWWAVGEARAAKAMDAAASGKKPPGDVWFVVADAFDRSAASAAPPGDAARLRCIRRLLESAGTVATQGNVVVTRALGVAQKALKDPAAPAERRLEFATTIYDATQVLVQTDRPGARECVKAAHALLRPVHAGDATPREVATLWNRWVTFDRSSKFGVGEKYLTTRVNFLEGQFTIDLPIGTRWSAEGGSSGADKGDWGERRDPTRIIRLDADGQRMAWILGLTYGSGWTFRNPETRGIVGGDNPGGIADLSVLRYGLRYYKHVSALKKPRKGKVGNGIAAHAYQVDGTGNSDKPLRVLGWVFRGPGQSSFELTYFNESPSDEPDPELDAVMDSVREVE